MKTSIMHDVEKIGRLSMDVLGSMPRLQMAMTHDPDVLICGDVLQAAAKHIEENAVDGRFTGDFLIEKCQQKVEFNVDCTLRYRREETGQYLDRVDISYAFAETFDEDNIKLTNDFSEREFLDYFNIG